MWPKIIAIALWTCFASPTLTQNVPNPTLTRGAASGLLRSIMRKSKPVIAVRSKTARSSLVVKSHQESTESSSSIYGSSLDDEEELKWRPVSKLGRDLDQFIETQKHGYDKDDLYDLLHRVLLFEPLYSQNRTAVYQRHFVLIMKLFQERMATVPEKHRTQVKTQLIKVANQLSEPSFFANFRKDYKAMMDLYRICMTLFPNMRHEIQYYLKEHLRRYADDKKYTWIIAVLKYVMDMRLQATAASPLTFSEEVFVRDTIYSWVIVALEKELWSRRMFLWEFRQADFYIERMSNGPVKLVLRKAAYVQTEFLIYDDHLRSAAEV